MPDYIVFILISTLSFLAGVRVERLRWSWRVRDLHNLVEGARIAKQTRKETSC